MWLELCLALLILLSASWEVVDDVEVVVDHMRCRLHIVEHRLLVLLGGAIIRIHFLDFIGKAVLVLLAEVS